MARIILNNKECDCLDDIKSAISGEHGNSALEELCQYYVNQSLLKWLEEGCDPDELAKAKEIKGMKFNRESNTSLKRALISVFGGETTPPEKPDFKKHAKLTNILFLQDGIKKDISLFNSSIYIETKRETKGDLHFTFHVFNPIKESYTLSLKINPKNPTQPTIYDNAETISLNMDSAKIIPFRNIYFKGNCGVFDILLSADNTPLWKGTLMCNISENVKIQISDDTDYKMVFVPGNDAIPSFYIGETVVTRQMACRLDNDIWKGGARPYNSHDFISIEKRVLNPLKEKLGCSFRLPTKQEWYYAARGGKEKDDYPFDYPGGNDIDKLAIYDSDNLQPVRQKGPNELGLFDMAGNVWEMTADKKTFCGGCYSDSAKRMRIKKRSECTYDYGNDDRYGVRLVCDVEEMARWLSMQQNNDDTEPKDLKDERDRLVQQYNQMKQNDQTYENNLGFLSVSSKKGNLLIDEMKHKMQKNKEDMELVKERIRVIDEESKCHGSHIYFSASSTVANLPKTQSSIEEEIQENIEPEPSVSQTIEEIYPTLRKTKETIWDSYRDAFRKALHSVSDEAQGNDSTLDSKIELAAQHYRENNGLSSIVSSLKTHKDSQDSYQDNNKYHNKARRIITKCCSRDNVSESMNFTQSGLSFVKLLKNLERHGVYLTKSGVVRCCSTVGDVVKLIAQELYFAESK